MVLLHFMPGDVRSSRLAAALRCAQFSSEVPDMQISDHLFRREWGRMVAALARLFGVHNLALAEDVVQEEFCRAMEAWPYRGVPDNPQAWLMSTAKNYALDVLRRERTAWKFAPELERYLQSEWTLAPAVEELLGPQAIKDDLLRMIFSCCQPQLPVELARQHSVLYRFLLNKWYFDEIYDVFLVRPTIWLGRLLWKRGDGWLIDGFGPDGVSKWVLDVTRNVVRLQTGYMYHYAFVMLIGVAGFITWFMFAGGGQ